MNSEKNLFLILFFFVAIHLNGEELISDNFTLDGELQGYTTNNASALPEVSQLNGRYHAKLTNNSNDRTLHYNQDQGRLDAKLVHFPFVYIARNIGIGTIENSQSAPTPVAYNYIFCGVQVHVKDLTSLNSSHVVIGHRGEQEFTIEGKNTIDGWSAVNDDGFRVLPQGRGDIRIEGLSNGTLVVSWQAPNLTGNKSKDQWNLYRGNGILPNFGTAPRYEKEVYIGLITYAYGRAGIPFVGTCDAIEFEKKVTGSIHFARHQNRLSILYTHFDLLGRFPSMIQTENTTINILKSEPNNLNPLP